MEKKENFKTFVRTKPNLVSYVENKQMTWQQFYEIWDLYGPEHEVWQQYEVRQEPAGTEDLMQLLKGIDLNRVRHHIGTIQRGIGLIQELLKQEPKGEDGGKEPYQPRPLFQRFDD